MFAAVVVVACRNSVGRPNVGAAEAGRDTEVASGFGFRAAAVVVGVGTTPVLILRLGVYPTGALAGFAKVEDVGFAMPVFLTLP